MQRPTRSAPPPLKVDTLRVVLAGMAVWALALVVLLILGDRVDRMWTWTCVAALGLAAVGIWIMQLQGQLPSQRSARDRETTEPSATARNASSPRPR